MATAAATILRGERCYTTTWTLTSTNTDGAPVPFLADYPLCTWTVTGTWGGATLKTQGSADASTFAATGMSLAGAGTEASATADKVFSTLEQPKFIRPNLTTAGSGATIAVTLIQRAR